MCHRRRGISTVLGTLIFIGILFTAVIPMALVMKQAETIYEQKKLEQQRRDEERAIEDLLFYAYPTGEQTNVIESIVYSECSISAKIIRMWINDDYYSCDTTAAPMANASLPSQTVTLVDGKAYYVMITTERGKVYACESGALFYSTADGWSSECLSIEIIIESWGSRFRISITQVSTGDKIVENEEVTKTFTGSTKKTYYVPAKGFYTVKVERRLFWSWSTIFDNQVEITWPGGPPTAVVYC
jgi:hypothetical protein